MKKVRQFQKRKESRHSRPLRRLGTRGYNATVSPGTGDIVRFKIDTLRKQIAQLHELLEAISEGAAAGRCPSLAGPDTDTGSNRRCPHQRP